MGHYRFALAVWLLCSWTALARDARSDGASAARDARSDGASAARFERAAPVREDRAREATAASESGEKKQPTDRQIKQLLIQESIDAYSGNCPCPYSRARNGSRCGRRSAHSRAGGEAPLCFESDVSAEMVRHYRETHALD